VLSLGELLDDVSPVTARPWIEKWMVWLPGAIGAVSFSAGSVMQMVHQVRQCMMPLLNSC
jgi:hypothetical protein